MQTNPSYENLMGEISDFLAERAKRFLESGGSPDAVCIDPGFGFGKTPSQNFEMLARLGELLPLGFPILFGASRKSSLGAVTGSSVPAERIAASVEAHMIAARKGALILRVHDVKETVQALAVAHATLNWQGVL